MRLLRLARQLILNKLSSAPAVPSSTELAVYCDSTNALALRKSTGVERVVSSDNLSPASGNVPTWNGTKWIMQTPAAGGGATPIVKSADESRANDTVQTADSELTFALDANSTYVVSAFLLPDSNGADMRYSISLPVDAVGIYEGTSYGGSFIANGGLDGSSVNINTDPDQANMSFRTITAGTFAITWAQGVSSGTATTMLEGSSLLYQKL